MLYFRTIIENKMVSVELTTSILQHSSSPEYVHHKRISSTTDFIIISRTYMTSTDGEHLDQNIQDNRYSY